MKTAVHFGAGNIGRGFIAPILQENEYEVIFVDINSELIKQINNLNQYKITSLSLETSTNQTVENVCGIDLNDNSKLTEKISEADLITTSVGPKFVNDIFTKISNINTNKEQAFIAFENMYRASTNNPNKKYRDQLILIDAVVEPLIEKVMAPFLGYAMLSVDSTSREKIRWDKISIRPEEVVVNKNVLKTSDSDFESYFTVPISDAFIFTHKEILEEHKPWSILDEVKEKIIAEHNGFDLSISKIGNKTFQNISQKQK